MIMDTANVHYDIGNEHGRNRYDLAWTNSAIWSGSPFRELDHDTIYIGQVPGRNLERL